MQRGASSTQRWYLGKISRVIVTNEHVFGQELEHRKGLDRQTKIACSVLYWLCAGMARPILQELRKMSTSIKQDLNPLHSVLHTRAPTTTPPLLSLLPIIIPPFHRQTLETSPANHWQPIPNLPSPSPPYCIYVY